MLQKNLFRLALLSVFGLLVAACAAPAPAAQEAAPAGDGPLVTVYRSES